MAGLIWFWQQDNVPVVTIEAPPRLRAFVARTWIPKSTLEDEIHEVLKWQTRESLRWVIEER